MGALLGQVRGRSKRARRVLLEVELVRALERVYAFELRSRPLAPRVDGQTGAPDVQRVDPAWQESIETLRREVALVLERCRRLETICGLAMEVRAECAPVGVERTTAEADPDEVASTQRCPQPPWSREADQ
jgi:hypothetical protein